MIHTKKSDTNFRLNDFGLTRYLTINLLHPPPSLRQVWGLILVAMLTVSAALLLAVRLGAGQQSDHNT
jgi:hypothetical protein